MKVSVEILPQIIPNRDYFALVNVVDGNNTTHEYRITRNGEYITSPSNYVLGDCSFDLPKSGNVKIILVVGYIYDSGIGNSACNGSIELFSSI